MSISQFLPPLPSWPAMMPVTRLLSLPLGAIPRPLHSKALTVILNRILSEALQQDELLFLQDRVLQIQILDLGLDYRMTLSAQKLTAATVQQTVDVSFAGNLREFMLLALNKEDPDSLFFQRRLQLQGDTELGLEIKNFLYTLDESILPRPIRQAAERVIELLPQSAQIH